jgi:hypothetical protein
MSKSDLLSPIEPSPMKLNQAWVLAYCRQQAIKTIRECRVYETALNG